MKIYDADIRKLLFEVFSKTKSYTNNDTVIINEMDVCAGISRADIAVINGKIHGYEIKSGQDNLERLPMQMESYNQVFDTMTIVAFENHIDKITQIVPDWWGIKCVQEKNGRITLRQKRKGCQNKEVNIKSVAMLLWREEMIELLNIGNVNKGYKSKTRYALSDMIVKYIEPKVIDKFVRATLKTRTNWKAEKVQQLNGD